LDIRKISSIKEAEETVGARVRVKVVKNKIAPPFRTAEFDLMHDHGISREGDLLDLGIDEKIIEKSGAWINYGDMRLGQGRENSKQFLRDNPALVDEITRKVLAKRVPAAQDTPPAEAPAEVAPAPAAPSGRGRRAAAES
jgi:recombination protein RecA